MHAARMPERGYATAKPRWRDGKKSMNFR